MDNAKQMETIAALESQTSEMSKENQLTADAIHEKLAAECKDKVDVLVIDVIKAQLILTYPGPGPYGLSP